MEEKVDLVSYSKLRYDFEDYYLSPYAFKCSQTKGRAEKTAPCPLRTEFMRDRDRILHCKSFRRLKHKTQVFLSPEGDHYRTRLTHTLEVSQIGRTIARALNLNEDLVEAIALGHDLGHTPFGHAGERALQNFVPFEHNEQSLRVVDVLENDGLGLNLTFEVRDGILHHKKSGNPSTLEGRVVSYADRIAYLNHDIDDAERGGILHEFELPDACTDVLGHKHGARINNMILDIVAQSIGKNEVVMSKVYEDATDGLRCFLFEHVYSKSEAKAEEGKAIDMIGFLYEYYIKHEDKLPTLYRGLNASKEQRVCDFVSSMTDRYAVAAFETLFVPQSWRK